MKNFLITSEEKETLANNLEQAFNIIKNLDEALKNQLVVYNLPDLRTYESETLPKVNSSLHNITKTIGGLNHLLEGQPIAIDSEKFQASIIEQAITKGKMYKLTEMQYNLKFNQDIEINNDEDLKRVESLLN